MRKRTGCTAGTFLLAALLVVSDGCRLDPITKESGDALNADLQQELARFRTRTDSNAACLALGRLRARVRTEAERRRIDRRIYRVLSPAAPKDLPARCIELLARLPQSPRRLFLGLLQQASLDHRPRAFAAAARALGHRWHRPDLLAAAALLTHMTGDGGANLDGLDCSTLTTLFDRVAQNEAGELTDQLDRLGWNRAGPVRQAAWWLLVLAGCSREAWARSRGTAPALKARALGRIPAPAPGVPADLAAGTLSTQAALVRSLGRMAPARIEPWVRRAGQNPCPKDPGRRALRVALLQAVSTSRDAEHLAETLLETMERCPEPWPFIITAWRKAQAR